MVDYITGQLLPTSQTEGCLGQGDKLGHGVLSLTQKIDWEDGWHFVRVLAESDEGELVPLVDDEGKPLP